MSALPNNGPRFSADVCVLGGGPAGAAAALRLAQLGHRVCVVERGGPRSTPAGVSLPPSVLPMLDLLGVQRTVAAAGFLRPPPALVHWHGMTQPADAAPGLAGFQVDRAHFDRLLLQTTQGANVQLLHEAALQPQRQLQAQADGWSVPLAGGGHIDAHCVIDARGRRGTAQGPRTVALMARWHRGEADAVFDPRTRVQASHEGWAWLAPMADGSTVVAVFVDAQRCARLGPVDRQALHDQLLAPLDLLQPALKGCSRGPVQACDATPRSVQDAAPQPGLLHVGEAAFSIDPLSSQGVPAALRSAWQAAACVHTARHRPAHAALAWQFHRQQSQRTAQRHQHLAARFYAAAAQVSDHPFWHSRAGQPAPPSDAAAWPGLDDTIALDSRARWCDLPVLEGEWVVARDALDHPALDCPVAFLAGQPASAWLQALQGAPRLRDLLDAWHRHFGAATTQAIWPWLWQQGLLQART